MLLIAEFFVSAKSPLRAKQNRGTQSMRQRPATAESFRTSSKSSDFVVNSTKPSADDSATPLCSSLFATTFSYTGTETAKDNHNPPPPAGTAYLLGRVSSLTAVIGDPFTRKTFLHHHHNNNNSGEADSASLKNTLSAGINDSVAAPHRTSSGAIYSTRPQSANSISASAQLQQRQPKTLKALKEEMSEEDQSKLFYRPTSKFVEPTTSANLSSLASRGGGAEHRASHQLTMNNNKSGHSSTYTNDNSHHHQGGYQRPATAGPSLFFSMQQQQQQARGSSNSNVLASTQSRNVGSLVDAGVPQQSKTLNSWMDSQPSSTGAAGATMKPVPLRPASALLVSTKAKLEGLLREEGAALMAARDKESTTDRTLNQQREEINNSKISMSHQLADDQSGAAGQRFQSRPLSSASGGSDSASSSSAASAPTASLHDDHQLQQQLQQLQFQLDRQHGGRHSSAQQQQQHEPGTVTEVWDDSLIDPKLFSAAATPDPHALIPPWSSHSTSPPLTVVSGAAAADASWRLAGGSSIPRSTSAFGSAPGTANPLSGWSRPTSAQDAQLLHRRPPTAPRAGSSSSMSSANGSGGLPPTSRSVSPATIAATTTAPSALSCFDGSNVVLIPKIYQQQQQQVRAATTPPKTSGATDDVISPPLHALSPENSAEGLLVEEPHDEPSAGGPSDTANVVSDAESNTVQVETSSLLPPSRPASAYAAKFRQKLVDVMSEPTTPHRNRMKPHSGSEENPKDIASVEEGASQQLSVPGSNGNAVPDSIAAFLEEHFFSLRELETELQRVEGALRDAEGSDRPASLPAHE